MKKNRPGVILTVLVSLGEEESIAELIFAESTSIGLRYWQAQRFVCPREQQIVKTPWGAVGVKVSSWQGKIVNVAPEYEDCVQVAAQAKLPLKEVFDLVKALWRKDRCGC